MNPPYIISASRRTDIPAFYNEWFINRIRAGFLKVIHPYSRKELTISLKPKDVICIVFWTKNFKPMFKYLNELEEKNYFYLVHYTITGLGREFEPRVPEVEEAIETFIRLSERIGSERIFWRFDPIIITNRIGEQETIKRFEAILKELKGYTRRVYFSFVQMYARVKRRIKHYEKSTGDKVLEPNLELKLKISHRLKKLAHRHKISLFACCEPELVGFGIEQAHCIDAGLISKLTGKTFSAPLSPSRKFCGCYYSLDIGAYDTCPHLCWYCYANSHPKIVQKRFAQHSPKSEFLLKY